MKLGIVTYQIAAEMDVPTIIDLCSKTGIEGVELRTTHAHGVEVELSAGERAAVRKQFEDSSVEHEEPATRPRFALRFLDETIDRPVGLDVQFAEPRHGAHGRDGGELAMGAVEFDQFGDVQIGDAVTIGHHE